jgi:hypothetical protein
LAHFFDIFVFSMSGPGTAINVGFILQTTLTFFLSIEVYETVPGSESRKPLLAIGL